MRIYVLTVRYRYLVAGSRTSEETPTQDERRRKQEMAAVHHMQPEVSRAARAPHLPHAQTRSPHANYCPQTCRADECRCQEQKRSHRTEEELRNIWGTQYENEEIREKILKTLMLAEVRIAAEEPEEEEKSMSENEQDSSEDASSSSDDRDKTVRRRKKEMGLGHCSKDNALYKLFVDAATIKCKTKRAAMNNASRLSQFLAFAIKENPTDSDWDQLVNTETAEKFLAALESCKQKDTTMETYVKTMSIALTFAEKRWKRVSSRPNSEEWQNCLQDAITFWGDKRRAYDRKARKIRNKNLAEGEEAIADTDACLLYVEDQAVLEAVQKALDRLSALAKLRTSLSFKKEKTEMANINAYNKLVRYMMSSAIIRNGGVRTGVLENLTIDELLAAREQPAHDSYQVKIAEHKTEETDVAHLILPKEDYLRMRTYLQDVRSKMRVKDKDHRKLLFVTTGGQPFRDSHRDANHWMEAHGYKRITTTLIRKATQTGVAAMSSEIQNDVSAHLSHSVSTARLHYRATTADTVQRRFDAVTRVQNNVRVLKRISPSEDFFQADEECPTKEAIEERMREVLRVPGLEIDGNTYKQIKDIYVARKQMAEN